MDLDKTQKFTNGSKVAHAKIIVDDMPWDTYKRDTVHLAWERTITPPLEGGNVELITRAEIDTWLRDAATEMFDPDLADRVEDAKDYIFYTGKPDSWDDAIDAVYDRRLDAAIAKYTEATPVLEIALHEHSGQWLTWGEPVHVSGYIVGYAFIPPEKVDEVFGGDYDKAYTYLKAVVSDMDSIVQGDVYCVLVDGVDTETGDEWTDAVCGCVGWDSAEYMVKEILSEHGIDVEEV